MYSNLYNLQPLQPKQKALYLFCWKRREANMWNELGWPLRWYDDNTQTAGIIICIRNYTIQLYQTPIIPNYPNYPITDEA